MSSIPFSLASTVKRANPRRFRVELVWERAEEVTRTLGAYRKLLAGELSAAEALEAASVHERYGVTTPLRVRKR